MNIINYCNHAYFVNMVLVIAPQTMLFSILFLFVFVFDTHFYLHSPFIHFQYELTCTWIIIIITTMQEGNNSLLQVIVIWIMVHEEGVTVLSYSWVRHIRKGFFHDLRFIFDWIRFGISSHYTLIPSDEL